MVYKQKAAVLSGIIAALAVVYILTFIFSPERTGSRSDVYTWLEPDQKDRISGITITGGPETVSLERKQGAWYVSRGGKDYPARQARAEDFIEALAKRAPYPVWTTSAASHERLSLTDDAAIRVTVLGGAGPPLLSLLIGQGDTSGRNVYLRKQGSNEVRSGEDIFSLYAASALSSWFNLRLLSDSENLDAASVQRITVYPPADFAEAPTQPQIFTRSGKEWKSNITRLETEQVNAYLRDLLNTEGNDFADTVSPSDPLFNNSRIVLELGNGSIRTIRLGPEEDGRRLATVSGSDAVYSVPAWASQRLFPETAFFEQE